VTAVANVRGDRLPREMSSSAAASVEERAAVTADIACNLNGVMTDGRGQPQYRRHRALVRRDLRRRDRGGGHPRASPSRRAASALAIVEFDKLFAIESAAS
jgi:hypothetical protein